MEEGGASTGLTEDFINYPRSLEGTEVALLFREISSDEYRISLRSRGTVDVAKIAREFQGGGHPNAAGCTLEGTLLAVRTKILTAVRAAF